MDGAEVVRLVTPSFRDVSAAWWLSRKRRRSILVFVRDGLKSILQRRRAVDISMT